MKVTKKQLMTNQQKIYEADLHERNLRDSLESLCLRVSCLEDAGLPVQHKSTIAYAKKLRHLLQKG